METANDYKQGPFVGYGVLLPASEYAQHITIRTPSYKDSHSYWFKSSYYQNLITAQAGPNLIFLGVKIMGVEPGAMKINDTKHQRAMRLAQEITFPRLMDQMNLGLTLDPNEFLVIPEPSEASPENTVQRFDAPCEVKKKTRHEDYWSNAVDNLCTNLNVQLDDAGRERMTETLINYDNEDYGEPNLWTVVAKEINDTYKLGLTQKKTSHTIDEVAGWLRGIRDGTSCLPDPEPEPLYKVEVTNYEHLSEKEKEVTIAPPWGTLYIKIIYKGKVIWFKSDHMTYDMASFGGDLNWVPDALTEAYELGLRDGRAEKKGDE